MSRQKRLVIDKNYYHILTRGNNKRRIFRSGRDYRIFIKVVDKYLSKFQVNIIHYCLMKNHVHLLIYVERAKDLSKFMQAVLQTYGAYFRKRYECVGFTFQNRYKSHLIDKDTYLLECARYIERNPIRARLVDSLSSYPWSSFSFYAKGINDKIVNKVNLLYCGFGQTPQIRQKCYQKYILEERPYEVIIDEALRI